jgi:SRSO17 transposase
MMSDFSDHFVVRGNDLNQHAADYLSGLLGTERRKNLEGIHQDIPESNYQGIQQFVTDSPWDEGKLMEQVATEVNGILGGHPHSALLIDETGFVKKGEASVGVQRQYCGRLGKKENCQMGVFACLGRGEKAAIVNFRLFLPESWAQDDKRCELAKIPKTERRHRSKLELALEMIERAKSLGLGFEWVLADAAYGCSLEFCARVEELGLKFLCDVSATNSVWDADPQPGAPAPAEPGRGRPRAALVAGNRAAKKWRAVDLVKSRFEKESREVVIRRTTKGPLRARVWVGEVWLWEKGTNQAKRRMLVAREMEDGELKISWTNAPTETTWEVLAYMQAQRHWVERAFEDGKSELGMAQYEVRKWRGWHHHMALVSLAMLFVLKERVSHAESVPLLSARDVVELLEFYLPRRGGTEAEVLADLVERHNARIAAATSHERGRRRAAENVTK